MYKRNVRSFSLGILFSVILVAIYTFMIDEKPADPAYTENTARTYLEDAGYTVLTEEEYNAQMNTQQNDTEKQQTAPDPIEETENESDAQDTVENEQNVPEAPSASFELEINNGMTPSQISSLLEQAGMIENADEFTQFVEENGYSTKIQLGVFEISKGMSSEEIAKIITKS